MERLLCVILNFAEILKSVWSNLYKVDTCLQRAHWIGPVVVRYSQVSLYSNVATIAVTDIQRREYFFIVTRSFFISINVCFIDKCILFPTLLQKLLNHFPHYLQSQIIKRKREWNITQGSWFLAVVSPALSNNKRGDSVRQ